MSTGCTPCVRVPTNTLQTALRKCQIHSSGGVSQRSLRDSLAGVPAALGDMVQEARALAWVSQLQSEMGVELAFHLPQASSHRPPLSLEGEHKCNSNAWVVWKFWWRKDQETGFHQEVSDGAPKEAPQCDLYRLQCDEAGHTCKSESVPISKLSPINGLKSVAWSAMTIHL